MEAFPYLPENGLFNNQSLIGGTFDEKNLDTTIGLKSDMDVGQISSLFDSIKNPDVKKDGHSIDKRDSPLDANSVKNENCGNNTIWIIVIIVVIVLILIAFIIYKISKTKKVQDKARQMYTNISDKLSSIRDGIKKTTIDS